MKTKPFQPEAAARVGLSHHVIGYQDYIASRVLLRKGLLLQGAVLASTAVEKNFKAFLAAKGIQAFGHLSDWSSTRLKQLASELELNADFLLLLQIVYRTRYLDDVKEPVSFSIERLKCLVELDWTVHKLRSAVEFRRGNEPASPYKSAIAERREELCSENFIVDGIAKDEFLRRPDVAESFYIDKSLEIISCRTTGWIPKDRASFSCPGIRWDGRAYHTLLV